MDLMQIIQRSLSGYIFVVLALLLYFLILKWNRKKQTWIHIIAAFIFCYYLIGILTMTGIGKLTDFSPNFVWIPFVDMVSGPIDTILNVFLFIPLGFFLPLLYDSFNKMSRVVVFGFLFSLSVEIVQMFGRGATDINDLITNTVGTCLGYFIYQLLSSITKTKLRHKFKAVGIKDYSEVLLFSACSFLIMVTIQPYVIHMLFHLG